MEMPGLPMVRFLRLQRNPVLPGRPSGSGRVGPQRPQARPEGRSAAAARRPAERGAFEDVEKVLIRVVGGGHGRCVPLCWAGAAGCWSWFELPAR